jgi:hypothetical protein
VTALASLIFLAAITTGCTLRGLRLRRRDRTREIAAYQRTIGEQAAPNTTQPSGRPSRTHSSSGSSTRRRTSSWPPASSPKPKPSCRTQWRQSGEWHGLQG